MMLMIPGIALADPAVVEDVHARATGDTWHFEVTLSHGDTGWDDYANGWRILGPDGAVLATRTLLHPHVNEQPFTRSLSNVKLPEGATSVTIEASDTLGGWGGKKKVFTLPK
ncbi:hypothetical protein IV417_18440 [Alphaproteobacteria bacterium KMM 3653]|uniref:Uncharacterized protein n=2 Tax=Harenicola maris TaxID=2841044 RepID=A0AAP2CRV3_9RHOB|nr:hypothetical protein [Harenicola maris]